MSETFQKAFAEKKRPFCPLAAAIRGDARCAGPDCAWYLSAAGLAGCSFPGIREELSNITMQLDAIAANLMNLEPP